jgi:hypothetical protein
MERSTYIARDRLQKMAQKAQQCGFQLSALMILVGTVPRGAAADMHALANPLVAGEFGLRFYVGVPLPTHDGFNWERSESSIAFRAPSLNVRSRSARPSRHPT